MHSDKVMGILEQRKKHHLPIIPICLFALAPSGGCKRSPREMSLYVHAVCCTWKKYWKWCVPLQTSIGYLFIQGSMLGIHKSFGSLALNLKKGNVSGQKGL